MTGLRPALLAIAALAVTAPVAGAATAQQAIDELNAQRAANGLPAGITENPTWTTDCMQHDNYMYENGTLTHEEDSTKPGYTSEGAFAGMNAVLGEGTSWDSGNPFNTAPLHLDQLLAPRLVQTGSADYEGFTCTTTFPGWTRPDPAALTVYTYPGNGATTDPSENADELPFTPGSLDGIPIGTTTGPDIIVFADAPNQQLFGNPATLSGATLTGPSGPVQVDTVDGNTPIPGGGTLAGYIASGGFIIPVSPLQPGTTYHAHVVVGFAGAQTPHDWSFTTTGTAPPPAHSSLTSHGATLSFSSNSSAPVLVTLTRANGDHAPSVTIAPGKSVNLHLAPGRWQACGQQSATQTYSAYKACVTVTITGVPSLSLGAAKVRRHRLQVALHFSSALRGRRATLTVTPLTRRCSRGRCQTAAGRASRRTITLTASSLSFSLPGKRHGLRIQLATAKFTLGDAPWAAAHVAASYLRR